MKHNKTLGYSLVIIAAIFAAALIINAQQQSTSHPMQHADDHATCPMMQGKDNSQASAVDHAGHADGMAEMNKRGEREMGFSQEKTTHHFRLMKDGGAIEVEVNDAKDTAMRDRVRQHLVAIAQAFSDDDFATPFAVHAQVPSGVPVMKRLKEVIKYKFEETEKGGRVRISTTDGEALTAIHDFLSFQIREHRTGDPME
ncbi:MAG: hypothetical protein H0W99_07630 [Acidobacteria bacterium]|nr:hypothetical protein [Acidobacteriota bacterium]